MLQFMGVVTIDLDPLAPLSRPTFELARVRVSGRLFYGRAGFDAAMSGSLSGLVAGVDFVDVRNYDLVRLRGVRDGVARVDHVFEQLTKCKRGQRYRITVERERTQAEAERDGRTFMEWKEREQVIILEVQEAAAVPLQAARLYEPALPGA